MNNRSWFGSWRFAPAWLGLLGLAVALRAYHLPGFVVNNDEGHWLIYTLSKRLLFEPLRNSHPRPDVLFPWLASIPVHLFGPNELALRLWPMIIGSLSLFPLAALVFEVTGSRRAALFAAAFLAVMPLPVYFSAQGTPDTIAFFLGLCALVGMMRARRTKSVTNFIGMGICLALALLTKATALYGWGFMAIAGIFLFGDQDKRRTFYMALAFSAMPLVLLTIVISMRSQTLSFFREPGVTETFGFSLARAWLQLRYLIGFYELLLLLAAIGAVRTYRAARTSPENRLLLVWLLPLANLIITPFFRPGRVELLWLIPSVCLFAAVALTWLRRPLAWTGAAALTVVLLARSLFGLPLLPYPGRAKADSDYTTAVLKRPAGWPSRDAARWLMAHTSPEDAILLTAYTFTDPLLLELNQSRRVVPNAGENWALLRDPANRVRYVVFTQDYRSYAPALAAYADAHFTLPADAQFAGYAIYDCQKRGKLAAYPDAYGSNSRLMQEGVEFLKQHQLERAAEAFQGELAVNPDQPVASVDLALVWLQLGRDAEGVAQCERNIRLGIEPSVSYGVLGQFRERQGDLARAQAAYEASLTLDPHNEITLRLLADLKTRRQSSGAAPAR